MIHRETIFIQGEADIKCSPAELHAQMEKFKEPSKKEVLDTVCKITNGLRGTQDQDLKVFDYFCYKTIQRLGETKSHVTWTVVVYLQ